MANDLSKYRYSRTRMLHSDGSPTYEIYDGNWKLYTNFDAEQRQYWEGVVQRVKAQHPSARIEIRECAPYVKYPHSPYPCDRLANNEGYSSVWYDTTALDITAIAKVVFGECSKRRTK